MTGQELERVHRLAALARRSKQQHEDDCAARDAAIWELAESDGWTYRSIAVECEMSPSHVQRIIMAETARRQAERKD
jgi:hypothetical protein